MIFALSYRRYIDWAFAYRDRFSLYYLMPVSLWIIENRRWSERYIQHLKQKVILLHGPRQAGDLTWMYAAQSMTFMYVSGFLFTFFSLFSQEPASILFIGFLFIVLIPLVLMRDLEKKIKDRKQKILLELPEVVNKILLLVNAGENVQKAVVRVAKQKENDSAPLYCELSTMVKQLENRQSFHQAMEAFSQRCAVQEVSMFVTTVLLNHKRGGDEVVIALRDLSRDLWDRRKNLARTLGEEASSKLIFPMVLIFIVVLCVVASPAVILLNR